MSRLSVLKTAVFLTLGMVVFAKGASAQSVIAGQVKDDTGAVLPGVTVEAASSALIEGRRAVSTDGQGRYSIVNLRPGAYSVTFALQGFTTVVRQGIDLPASFTATIDGTLKVATLEETVTVSAASPVVDVQQAQRVQVLDEKLLEAIVNTGSVWTQANMIAGIRISGADVGGSQYSVDLQMETHGASSLHNAYSMEGLSVDNASGDGSDNINYYVNVSNQQTVFETSGGTAESYVGGVKMNMIPRDGGNKFSGMGYFGRSEGAWQGNNFTDRVRKLGLTSVNSTEEIWDYSALAGGPIIKDKLWFNFTVRKWGNLTPVADSFYNDGSKYASWGEIIGLVPRLTWQATPRNKFVAHVERLGKYTGPRLPCCATYPTVPTWENFQAAGLISPNQRGSDPETASTHKEGDRPYGAWYAKWSAPVTSRLLLEAGHSTSFIYDGFPGQDGVDGLIGSPEWLSHVRRTDPDRNLTWGSPPATAWREAVNHEWNGAVSYVTGSHNIKVGFQDKDAREFRNVDINGGLNSVIYRSTTGVSVPTSVVVGNYPVVLTPKLDYDIGLYAQDRWVLQRLTASYGFRVQWLKSSVEARDVAAGRFVPARSFAETTNVPKWGPDFSPRFGLAYDLFGTAKTAVKFSVGKYFTRVMTAYGAQLNPMAVVTQTLNWKDADLVPGTQTLSGSALATNGDGIPQNNEIPLFLLPANFGTRNLAQLDPDFSREYNIETALSVQHELFPGVSVTTGWYRRTFKNMFLCHPFGSIGCTSNVNLSRRPSDYREVPIVNPYNGEIITAYDLKSAASLSQVDTFITNSPSDRMIYNGFEFALQARLPNGVNILASTTTQRTLTDACDVRDDPNLRRYCNRFDLPGDFYVPYRSDFKLAMNYVLPYEVQVSVNFTSAPGRNETNVTPVDELLPINYNISPNTVYTADNCAIAKTPGICTVGARVIPGMVQSGLIVPLVPAGTVRFMERENLLNLSVKKSFRLNRGIEMTPELDLFNALNADTVTGDRSANYGTATYGQANRILNARLPRIALRVKW